MSFAASFAILLAISPVVFMSGCGSSVVCGGVDCVQQLGTTAVACVNGVCASNDRCPFGYGHCSSDPTQICEAHLDTTQQCGACGNACTHDYEECTQPVPGEGRLVCLDPCTPYYMSQAKTIRCGEACVNLDIDNCGGCGVVCRSPSHGVSTCAAPSPAFYPSDYHCDAVCANGYFLSLASCLLPSRTWSAQALPGVVGTFYGIWGSSASDVYAVGSKGPSGPGIIYHSTGNGSWVVQTVPSPPQSFLSVWGSSASDIYAVGVDGLYHSSGDGNWTWETGNGANAIWGSGANDIYAVADSGTILHSTGGGQWDYEPWPTTSRADFYSVWGSGPNDVYVGGWARTASTATSVLAHSTGNGNWQPLTTNTVGPIDGIWGSRANDVYAVGAGPILRSTGNGLFVAQTELFQHRLFGVRGSGASDVYAVGSESTVLHSVGDGSWAPDDPSMAGSVHAMWGSGSGDVYVVGSNDDQSAIPGISHLP